MSTVRAHTAQSYLAHDHSVDAAFCRSVRESDRSKQVEENIKESAPRCDNLNNELAVAKGNRYTFEEKKKILEECKTLNSRELCVKYGLNKSVLSKWISNREIIKNAAKTSRTKTLKKVSETNELGTELFTWLSDCRCKGIPVSGPMLCRQALVINSRIGGPENFKASHGWLEKWKRRTHVKNLKITVDAMDDNTTYDSSGRFEITEHLPVSQMAAQAPTFLNEARIFEILEGQWIPLIDAMHRALLSAASNNSVQPPRSFTPVKDRGLLLSMPGYIEVKNISGEVEEAILISKLVTGFKGNPQREQPLPSILATILLFDITTGKLYCILEATEITARRTAAASVAATNILYNKRHSKTYQDPITLGILGAGVQGKSHAQAFHTAYKNISEIRIWNHRQSKAERLVAELKALGISQAVVAPTAKECAEGADVLVTATSASEPFLRGDWIKDGVHINAVGAGLTHYSELDLPLYQKAKIYLDDEAGGRSELHGLEELGIPLIAPVGDIVLKPDTMPGVQEVTVFHSCGMAAEDALAAQLVYKLHLQSQIE